MRGAFIGLSTSSVKLCRICFPSLSKDGYQFVRLRKGNLHMQASIFRGLAPPAKCSCLSSFVGGGGVLFFQCPLQSVQWHRRDSAAGGASGVAEPGLCSGLDGSGLRGATFPPPALSPGPSSSLLLPRAQCRIVSSLPSVSLPLPIP